MRQLYLLFFLLTLSGWAQTKQPYELGVNVFNYYTGLNSIGLPAIRDYKTSYCNGVFFRYDTNQYALRAQLNYIRTSGTVQSPLQFSEFYNMSFDGIGFNLAIGIQKQLYPNKKLFYAFSDIGYSRIAEQGISRGGWSGITETFVKKSNGVLLDVGIGSRLKIYKQVYFSPELCYLSEVRFVNEVTTPLQGGTFSQVNYMSLYVRPWLRFYLTFIF